MRRSTRIDLALFALALAVRALPAAHVFGGEVVYLRGSDAYYHLRRILYSIVNLPDALVFDPYVAFPAGARPIWPPLLDWLLALLLWPTARLGGEGAVERAAAWVPALLGAATVVVTWRVGRRHLGPRAGLAAGGLLAVLGGHTTFSQLGALDHPPAVGLLATALLAATLGLVAADASPLRRWAALGGLSAASLLVWPGSLLLVALALGAPSLRALAAPAPVAAASARGLAAAAGVATLAVAPFCLGNEWPQWSAWTPVVLTRFQPWLLGVVTLAALAWARLVARETRPDPLARLLAGLAIAGALVGASLVAAPGLVEGVGDAWRWLTRGEEFQARVIESQPLFTARGQVTAAMALRQLSWLLVLFPLAWLAGLADARRAERPAPRWVLLAWSLALAGVTLVQKRFLDSFSILFALQMGWGIELLLRGAAARWPSPRARRAAAAAVGIGVLLALRPVAELHALPARNLVRAARGEPIALPPYLGAERILHATARWLRLHTPPTRGWLDASQRPEYGVLAPWSDGHLLKTVARRPTVADNFGDDVGAAGFELERSLWRRPVEEALEILDANQLRYVVVRLGDPGPPALAGETLYRALLVRDGSGGSSGAAPAVGRLRLLHDSRPLQPGEPPLYRVFERVRGARIEGRVAPGAEVSLSLPLETNSGRRLHYRARLRGGPDGRYSFRVPYANHGGPDGVSAGERYQLRCGEERTSVIVDESQVRAGAVVAAPDLCPSAAAAPPDQPAEAGPRPGAQAWPTRVKVFT